MNRADEMVAQIEAIERDLVAAGASSDEKLNDELRAALKEVKTASRHWKGVDDLHNLLLRITRRLDRRTLERNIIHHRLLAIESETKKRGRRFARYLVAFCIAAAGIMGWQSYGEAAKQMIATRALQLGWSQQARQTMRAGSTGLAGRSRWPVLITLLLGRPYRRRRKRLRRLLQTRSGRNHPVPTVLPLAEFSS